ncbi:Structural constituent of cuticle [Halocaridina rubra]|uniref:Structural constituent of cuticle n=1 Tax=Halocaridina rubra TaxID=373956 RepID=A0AAN8XT55_HALRR
MSTKLLVVALALTAIASASARPDGPPPPPPYGPPPSYKEPGMPFEFAYAVKDDYTGNDFDHAENSDGKITSGSYRVVLPDGRTQKVTFSADHHNGYVAQVEYEGDAQYPAPAPSYPAPAPPAYPPPPPPPTYA